MLIPFRYDSASEFNDAGYAVVEIAGKWGVIDKTGKTIVPIEYDYAHNVENGMAVVERGGKFGAVDLTGRLAIPFDYEVLGSFDKFGLATANRWGQDGIINKENKVMLPFDFISAASAGDGFMRSFGVDGWKHYDPTGKEILSGYQPENVSKGGYFAAQKQGGKFGLFSKTGAVVLPEEYDRIEVGSNGTSVMLKKDGLYGLYDLKTKSWLIPRENQFMMLDGDRLVQVDKTENGPSYFADLSGKNVFGVEFQAADPFKDSSATLVKRNGKWGLIDRTGKFVLAPEFEKESIKFVSDDRIAAKKAEDPSCKPCGWGLTALNGQVILPFYYAKPDRNFFERRIDGLLKRSPFEPETSTHKYGVILDLRTGKPGVVDTQGNWILKPGEPYEDMKLNGASSFNDYGFLLPVKKNGKWGVYELNSRREIIPPTIVTDGDGFSEIRDENSHANFFDRDRGWGIAVYSTGKVFKPGAYSYEDYDEETKLLTVTKGGNRGSDRLSGKSAEEKAIALMNGSTGELMGLMRLDGTMVTKLEYDKLMFNRDAGDRYWAVKNGKGGWIDLNGRTIIPHVYDLWITEAGRGFLAILDSQSFDSDGLALVIFKGEVVLIDKVGKIVRRASDLGAPREAYLTQSDLGKTRYFSASYEIDDKKHEKFLINGKIYGNDEDAKYFHDDLIVMTRDGLYGYLDRAGNEVIPFIYTKAGDFNGGIASVMTDKDAFYINRRGERLYTIDPLIIITRRSRSMTPLIKNSEVVRTIDVAEAKQAFDTGAVFVDTRSAEGYTSEHIRGALNIEKSALEANITKLPKTKKIIAYCSCPREESSGNFIYELKKRGYTEVYALRGGTNAWKNAGFPMGN
ncbi:MAG: WG repeat-containing protein [Pyrinomonadaceae bacterium]